MGSSLSDGNLRRESIHVPRKSRSVENSCKQSSFSQTLLFISRVLESRRSSRHFICFQRRCWYGNVCTTPRRVTWPTSVCRRRLRTAVATLALQSPWTRTSTGQRSFAAYDPRTWNRLPTALRSPELSLSSFKRQLKTHSSVPALDSAGCSCECRVPSSHRRCCECTASSAPTTNV